MVVYTPLAETEEQPNFKAIYFSNEFPTDDLSILLRWLHNHSKQRGHVVLARFLNEATRALRNEVSQLRAGLAELVPSFESVTILAGETELRKGQLSQSIDGVLLCVLQLGTHCELYPEDLASRPNTVLTGLGVGILISTAVAVSTSLDDLVTAGIEVLRIAFRLGVFVGDVSQNLETVDTESSDSWAYVVYGLTVDEAQKELDEIQAKENTPSATLFRNYASFRDRKFAQLPVYGGLCHAPHIYTVQDAQAVLPFPPLAPRFTPVVPVLSSSSGEPFVASTAAELFEQVIFELMTKQIIWDNATRGVVKKVAQSYVHDVNIKVFRHSLAAQLLSSALTSTITHLPVETDDLLAWLTTDINDNEYAPGSSMQSKIAIVGMSCRMPGGATDTDKFWDLLEAGLDVHRKLPADRFDVDTHHDITGKRVNTTHTAYGCFIDEPGLLDAPFFSMSPREAEQTDPMQRLALGIVVAGSFFLEYPTVGALRSWLEEYYS
ncbi:hypothetical protein N7465_011573 [Penicillium sp. CMV-2018d]|nr:hypothetical protein N7465_011573 [Penicillium sp. CMV-2018d]